jgi:methionyl-tRNA formyltransferase
MTPQLDGGPCLAQQPTPIGPDETTPELETRLSEIGAELVLRTVDALAADRAESLVQNQAQASKAPRLKKTDGKIDWSRSAIEIRNQIRAFQPWPGSYTHWLRPDGEPLRLIVDRATVVPLDANVSPAATIVPGTVIESTHNRLVVATGKDALALDRIQPSGKRALTPSEFLNGYPVKVGQQFGE